MNEYQINVSFKGCFLFRTEWDDNQRRVRVAAMATQSMPDVEVTIRSRCKLTNNVTAEILRPEAD